MHALLAHSLALVHGSPSSFFSGDLALSVIAGSFGFDHSSKSAGVGSFDVETRSHPTSSQHPAAKRAKRAGVRIEITVCKRSAIAISRFSRHFRDGGPHSKCIALHAIVPVRADPATT